MNIVVFVVVVVVDFISVVILFVWFSLLLNSFYLFNNQSDRHL